MADLSLYEILGMSAFVIIELFAIILVIYCIDKRCRNAKIDPAPRVVSVETRDETQQTQQTQTCPFDFGVPIEYIRRIGRSIV